MYRYRDIRGVHLELTQRCNASCPQCARVSDGRTQADLPEAELSIDDVRTIFTPDFVAQLNHLYVCGNYGDALVAKDTLATFAHLRELNPKIQLKLITNGSGRDADWWRELARLVDVCVFSIDGLEDTNHLYRRGTQWPRIIAGVEAFVGAGGRAHWDYIVFRHNEHQVDEARLLSERLGFEVFRAKRTSRFRRGGTVVERMPVSDKHGETVFYLEMPSLPEWRNDGLVQLDTLLGKSSARFDGYLATTEISCKVAANRSVYIDAMGHVLPCCWVGHLYPEGLRRETHEVWKRIATLDGEERAIDARSRSVEAIVDGPLFQREITRGWSAAEPEGRLRVCASNCGSIDYQRAMYAPPSA